MQKMHCTVETVYLMGEWQLHPGIVSQTLTSYIMLNWLTGSLHGLNPFSSLARLLVPLALANCSKEKVDKCHPTVQEVQQYARVLSAHLLQIMYMLGLATVRSIETAGWKHTVRCIPCFTLYATFATLWTSSTRGLQVGQTLSPDPDLPLYKCLLLMDIS